MAGYRSTQIFSGVQVIDALENDVIDLILLDVMLPEINGFELMEQIKPFKIPVIYLTAKNNVMDKVTGLKSGAEDYQPNP